MTNLDRLTITLRARWSGDDPTPGALLASPKGGVVYRILEVWRVRRAGDHRHGFRLVCARLSRAEVPEGAEVLPWPRDARAPRESRRTGHQQRHSADPVPPEAIQRSKVEARAEHLARARRVGRDTGLVECNDYGPGLRLDPIHAHDGALLREADVMVADASDPDTPKRTIRRARRTDPLEVLKRAGTINAREHEAGEKLRCTIEQLQWSLPGVSRSEVHIAPQDRTEGSLHKLWACRKVREVLAALDITVTPAMLWVLHRGTIRGYAAFAHVRHTTAAELLRRGLGALADHYKLATPRAA